MAVVYQHRRKDTNEIFYIGAGKDKERAFSRKSRNRHWKNIVKKVGYDVDVLIEGISWEEACVIEIGLIKDYGRADFGLGHLVNMTDGGDGTTNHSPDVLKSISLKLTGRRKSRESAEKSAKSRTGLKRSVEAKSNMSKAATGKPKSIEHVRKMADSKKGNHYRAIPVTQWTEDGLFIQEYISQFEAAQKNNIGHKSINNNIKGLSKSAGGFIWKLK
jgi:hypothetical protein